MCKTIICKQQKAMGRANSKQNLILPTPNIKGKRKANFKTQIKWRSILKRSSGSRRLQSWFKKKWLLEIWDHNSVDIIESGFVQKTEVALRLHRSNQGCGEESVYWFSLGWGFNPVREWGNRGRHLVDTVPTNELRII